MKKAPSTILAAAGITVGLLGFALPASAAVPLHGNSGSHWKTTGSSNTNDKNKKQPQRNCPPPRPTRDKKQHHGHNGSPVLAESPNKQTTANGKNAPFHWGPPPHTVKCQPPPPPSKGNGNGKGNGKGKGNWNGNGNNPPSNGYPTGPTGQKNGPLP
jgi:hypothetical protein